MRRVDKTFIKGIHVLEALAKNDKPCGVTELAQQLNLTKSNVHRLLQTLVQCGYASRAPEVGHYQATLKLWELGSQVLSRISVKRVAAPYLELLAKETSETVHLSILDDGEVVYIDKIDSPQPVRAYSQLGGRAPAYCVATGKALLAYQPQEVIRRLASRLTRFTSRTVKSIAELERELDRVRQLGYAINRGEWRESICGIAAPILDASGDVVATVGLSGPTERLRPSMLRGFAPIVIQTARAISNSLGHHERQPYHTADLLSDLAGERVDSGAENVTDDEQQQQPSPYHATKRRFMC